jgi:hypothetical protein
VGIRDHQPHPSQPPPHQLPQELRPELVGLAGPYVEPQDFPGPILTYPNGYHRRSTVPPGRRSAPAPPSRPATHTDTPPPTADSETAPSLQIRETSLRLQPSSPRARTRSSTFRVLTPAQGRLLHHAHQRPLRPPAGLQQAREVAPLPQLGNPQGDLPHPGLPDPLPVPIPVRLALRSPLVPARPHLLRHLQLHQRLRQQPHPLPQHVQGPVPLELSATAPTVPS